MNNKKLAINGKTLKRVIGYVFKNYKKQFIFAIVCIIFSSIATVLSSVFLKTLIDDYITPLLTMDIPIYTGLIKALIIMGFIYLIGLISAYLSNRIMGVMSQRVLRDIRVEMFSKMQKLPLKYFDTNTHGDIMSKYTNDTDTLRQMISQSLPNLISCIISIVSVFCAMIFTSWQLTIFVVILTIFMITITKTIAGKSSKYFVNQQKSIGKLNGFIEEMISGSKVIKVFTHEEESLKDFEKLNNDLNDNMFKANRFANIIMPVAHNIGNIEYVLVAIVGGILALKYNVLISVGTLVSFLSLTRSFNNPIGRISNEVSTVIMALAGATRIFDMMDESKEIDDGDVTLVNCKIDKKGNIKESKKVTGTWAWKVPNGKKYDYVQLKGDVVLKNVNFSYNGEKKVLKDISLYAKPGQKIAFVGHTGAGKTTITNLLNRFYDIDDGVILYDGIDIKRMKKDSLRKSLAMVLQDTNLFTGTIKDNIKYGKIDATDEEVIKACKIANADSFIQMLPEGYDTVIEGNGANLSQGQRQLLSIARAALVNPPVMILDEATSSIDTRTEKLVQDGMDKLMKGRTVFVIAHRLSTIRNSKAIIVLENGEIIERGDHNTLLEEKGKYYELYTGKFELE